jgi:uncharacterized protein YjbJ (UPF0337 family)
MNKEQVKGKIDDAAGRVKRQVGEWTGDTKAQVEGTAQQIKGKVENAWGKTKEAVHDSHTENTKRQEQRDDAETERRRDRGAA